MVWCESTAEEVLFEWLQNVISSTDSKVGMSLFIISTFNFETERAKFFSDKVVGQII